MTDRLSLYNGALLKCKARRISSLTENCEARRLLDTAWDDGAVQYCLEQGFWNFAMRTVRIDATSDIEPDFGYSYAFDKPSDCIRTYAICYDEYFNSPIYMYSDEADYWFSEMETMYVQYISDGVEYGYNYGAWPQYFKQYVEWYLASLIVGRLTASNTTEGEVERRLRRAFIDARTNDATDQPTQYAPRGKWASARLRGRYYDGDRYS